MELPPDDTPLPLKKTALVVNAYIASTVSFLNHFSVLVEERLARLHADICRVEKVVTLLESKLAHIPPPEDSGGAAAAVPAAADVPLPAVVPDVVRDVVAVHVEEAPVTRVRDVPAYQVFLKRIQVGANVTQVKFDAERAGLNPDLLDTPDAPMSDAGSAPVPVAAPAPAPAVAPVPDGGAVGGGGRFLKLKDDPQYSKYFMMLRVGADRGGVFQKMQIEGIDPAILDMDPEGPSPNAHALQVVEDTM